MSEEPIGPESQDAGEPETQRQEPVEGPSPDGPDIPDSIHRAAEKVAEEEAEAAKWPPDVEVSKDERTLAMLVWLSSIFTAFIGPLIIFLMKREESRFVAFHALQCMFFNAVYLVSVIVLAVVTCFVRGMGGAAVMPLALIVCIVWAVKANNGEWARLPLVGDWARTSI